MDYIFIIGILVWLATLSNRITNIERGLHPKGKTRSLSLEQFLENAEPVDAPLQPIETKTVEQKPMIVPKPAEHDQELEFQWGSRVLTGVGIIAVVFGVGFFLRYAFDHNLITETMRVTLGIAGGLILVAIGAAMYRRYSLYAQILTGGGIGLLYLSLYAAHVFYNLISQPVAFAAMILVTIVATLLALWYHSLPLAGFALFGGFVTPFLLPTPNPDVNALFIYVLLLDIGFFVVAWRTMWSELAMASYVGTVLVYAGWYTQHYTSELFSISLLYSTIFFLLYFVLSLYYQQSESQQNRASLELIFLNPMLYYLGNVFEIYRLYHDWATLFTLALGVLYVAMACLAVGIFRQSIRAFANQVLLGIGFIFFAAAVPVYFDKHAITIAWGAEALVLLLIGLGLRMRTARLFGFFVSILVIARLIAFDLVLAESARPWWNDRVLTYVFSFVFFAVAACAYVLDRNTVHNKATEADAGDETNLICSYLCTAAYTIPVILLSAEIFDFHALTNLEILWSAWALIGIVVGIGVAEFMPRFFGYILFIGAGINTALLHSSVNLITYTPIFNGRVARTLILIVALSCSAWLMRQFSQRLSRGEKDGRQVLLVAINGFLLWIMSVEIIDYFNQELTTIKDRVRINSIENLKSASLSIGWTIYAIILLIAGIYQKSKVARIGSILLFGVVVLKVFLIDTANLDDFYRFISFISLGVILLIAGFLYFRFKDRIGQFLKASD